MDELSFLKIRWFNNKTKLWIIDYILSSDDCIISMVENSTKYQFCIAKSLAKDIFLLLGDVINFLLKQEQPNHQKVKLINLGLNTQNEHVLGQCEILVCQED